jgi:hypothetical protein
VSKNGEIVRSSRSVIPDPTNASSAEPIPRRRSFIKRWLGGSVAAGLLVLGVAAVADAHHPAIVAEADCEGPVIRYTATAWQSPEPDRRHNNLIVISLDGVDVDSGGFSADNGYSFSGVIQAEAGAHRVRATAAVGWGPNEDLHAAGDFRETSVVVPEKCSPPTTTPPVSTVSPPGTVATTTTLLGPSTTTTTTAPPEPGGGVQPSPPATPVPGQPTFTG